MTSKICKPLTTRSVVLATIPRRSNFINWSFCEAVRAHDRLGATFATAASEQNKRPALIGLGAATAGRKGQQIGTRLQALNA